MKRSTVLFALLATFVIPSAALATVKKEGTWPDDEKRVSFDASHVSRSEALTKLAEAAGWNLVSRVEGAGDPVDVHVKNEAPSKILEVLLEGGDFVAKRDGSLVSLGNAPKDAAAAPAVTAVAPPAAADAQANEPPPATAVAGQAAAVPSVRGEDRVAQGEDLVIEVGEVAHDVSVVGGDLDVRGTITGNAAVTGGEMKVQKGAHIVGNATAIGGALEVEDGAQIDGKVGVVGGVLKRDKGAKIGPTIMVGEDSSSPPHSILRDIGDAMTRAAMLFVFGAVLFALAGARMDRLRVEVASRPMHTLAMGIVASLASLVLFVALCVTVIGIPVALVGLLVGIFAAYSGICAVLATLGKALLGHRTDNPHLHLLVGCAVFLVGGAVPWFGGLMTAGVVLTGIGAVVATRAAGFAAGKNGGGPYRTLSDTQTY